jgi:Ser/Thr protein kinase RdoA (MazF antagonist)
VKLLAEGRASEIFDLGGGRVLRRFKRGGDPAFEARVMGHARSHGFPVPAVHEVREDGHPTVLAGLHRRLHEIPFEGAALLHRDLHPENVILSPNGPVVVDWTNAAAGEPALDVALVWVILVGTGDPFAARFARRFVAHFDSWEAGLDGAVAYRLADPNVTDEERARVQLMRNH